MKHFKKLAMAGAVSSVIFGVTGAQAATTAYSMYDISRGNPERLADLPVNDATANYSSNSAHSNYKAPNAWRDSSGALIASPNYGWAQGGGLPATWWVKMGTDETANVTAQDFVHARRQGGFIGGGTGNIADYLSLEPTTLSVGAAAYYDGANDTNWGHNADFGLFTLDQASSVTISVSGITNAAELIGTGTSNLRPGFSVWQGWDSAGATHNTTWKKNGYVNLEPGAANPFVPALSMMMEGALRGPDSLGSFEGTSWNLTNGGTATLTLNNLTAGNYTIVIGGVTDPALGATGQGGLTKQYQVSFSSVSAVPVPAAAWLFGPALACLGKFGRRKRNTTS